MSKRVLGRGLEALIPRETDEALREPVGERITMLPVVQITPNPRQPRQEFEGPRLEDLARSILEKGIVEPLIVRPLVEGCYELVAGERRLRAAQMAGLTEVPVLVRALDDRQSLEVALIENLQREDLNPVEEARAYLRLSEEFGRTHHDISREVGKDRSTITNLLRILRLPSEVLELVSRGTLTVGHARVLLGIEDSADLLALAHRMVSEGWNVRQAERHVSRHGASDVTKRREGKTKEKERQVVRVEDALRYALGAEVHLSHGPKGGKIEILYNSTEELERILDHLGIQVH